MFTCIRILMDPPLPPILPLSANAITECPTTIFSKNTQHFNFIKRNVNRKLVYKFKCISQMNGNLIMFFGNSKIRFFKKISSLDCEQHGKNQYFNGTDSLTISMIFIFSYFYLLYLLMSKKCHDNKTFSRENSEPRCESWISTC